MFNKSEYILLESTGSGEHKYLVVKDKILSFSKKDFESRYSYQWKQVDDEDLVKDVMTELSDVFSSEWKESALVNVNREFYSFKPPLDMLGVIEVYVSPLR